MTTVDADHPSAAPGGSRRLDAHVVLQLGTLDLDVAVVADPGEVVAILGPNGAGKTTLLRAIAGLVPLSGGRVTLGEVVLEDPAARVRLPPQERAVGVVFQDHLLFPHLSAVENVAFGPRSRGRPRAEARALATEWIARVDLADHAQARPRALSGGQSQRVALARALATEPGLLLLDEPMAALDVDARRAIRRELRRHLDAFAGPTLLITHEPLEAITLADRLVIIEQGRVVQDASPAEIARRPRSAWAAKLVGLNLYLGTGHGREVTLENGWTLAVADSVAPGEPGPTSATPDGEDVYAVIHPRAVALHATRPSGSPRNVWQGTVDALDLQDEHVRVHLDGPVPIVAQITPAALADLALAEGRTVWVAVKATEIEHWPA